EEERPLVTDRSPHRRVRSERKAFPPGERALLVATGGDDIDGLPVRREEADRPGPCLRRLDALRHDRVEHLLRRERAGEPRRHLLQPVRPRDRRLRVPLVGAATLEELRDEAAPPRLLLLSGP